MSTAKKTLYAAIGAGTTVIGKARELPQRVSRVSINLSDVRTFPAKVQELQAKVQAFGTSLPERATTAVELSKDLTERATKRATDLLSELTERGEVLYKKIQRSAPTKKATAQTKSAKSKVKAASTSVKKAVEADALAVKAAVETTADATV